MLLLIFMLLVTIVALRYIDATKGGREKHEVNKDKKNFINNLIKRD